MSGGVLISLYLFTLSAFLGLDLIRKVPPTLYGALAVALGACAAVVGVLALLAAGASASGAAGSFSTITVMVATAAVVGGMVRLRRLLQKRGGARR